MIARLARRALFARLARLEHGQLRIIDEDGETAFGRRTAELPVEVTVEVADPAVYGAALVGGTLALGETYAAGGWRADDLPSVMRLMARNHAVMNGLDRGAVASAAPLRRVRAWLERNTRAGSRRNIAAHYDLSDEFFRLFLDASMTYSCALYEEPGRTLEQAQEAKYERICQRLRLSPGQHVVEIGTGWGGFALHAARRHGCRVTTTTISRRQYDEARRRVAESGLGARIEVRQDDYRDLRGTYDKLVSIEMVEAVGAEHLGEYMARIQGLLRPDGEAMLQAIVIRDQEFRRAARETDFLKRHIFPGSCIPSVTALLTAATDASDLRLHRYDDLTPNYVTTLAEWRRRLLARWADARALGFDEVTLRGWEYYLAYCQGGFQEHYIGLSHLHLVRPAWRAAA